MSQNLLLCLWHFPYICSFFSKLSMYPVKTNLWERRQIPPDPPPIVATCLVGPVNYKWGQLTSNCTGPNTCLFLKSTPGIYCVYMPLWHQLINQKPLFSISENYSQHCQTTLSWSKYYSLVSVGVNRSVWVFDYFHSSFCIDTGLWLH